MSFTYDRIHDVVFSLKMDAIVGPWVKDNAMILVLDNSIDNILSLIDRSNLTPILGFNFTGVWTFKRDEMKLVTTNSKKLVKWRQFQEKLIRYDVGGL